jgi:hypothetical protein
MRLETIQRVLRCFVLSALLWAVGFGSAIAQSGFDRPGGDYASFSVRSGDPLACAQRCDQDGRCRAWTFAYPRTKNRAAVCWLKAQVPSRIEDACCISGVRGGGIAEPRPGAVEFGMDRFGGDYRNFDTVLHSDGALCAAACLLDGTCRAWTYARPGYVSAAPRCYLKNRVTTPQRKPCCISGVVR